MGVRTPCQRPRTWGFFSRSSARPLAHDAAGLRGGAAVRHGQRRARVLLDEHGRAEARADREHLRLIARARPAERAVQPLDIGNDPEHRRRAAGGAGRATVRSVVDDDREPHRVEPAQQHDELLLSRLRHVSWAARAARRARRPDPRRMRSPSSSGKPVPRVQESRGSRIGRLHHGEAPVPHKCICSPRHPSIGAHPALSSYTAHLTAVSRSPSFVHGACDAFRWRLNPQAVAEDGRARAEWTSRRRSER